jgi:hypothetical protein
LIAAPVCIVSAMLSQELVKFHCLYNFLKISKRLFAVSAMSYMTSD